MKPTHLIEEKVTSCRACWLGDANSGPVPYRGPDEPRIVVLGEAPGWEEDAKARPFVGPAGRHLKKLMKEAGLVEDLVGFLNVISCLPAKGEGVRAPKAPEIAACRPNLTFQLRVLKPEIVILAGNTALHQFRPELKITHVRGKAMVFDVGVGAFVAIPMLHPSALISAKSAKMNTDAVRDLKQAKWRLKHGWLERWHESCCVKDCEEGLEVYDVNGLGWCEGHRVFAREEMGMTKLDQQMELT